MWKCYRGHTIPEWGENTALFPPGWRILDEHEVLKDDDETGRLSLLLGHPPDTEGWSKLNSSPDLARLAGKTVKRVLRPDMDRRERVFRRKETPQGAKP